MITPDAAPVGKAVFAGRLLARSTEKVRSTLEMAPLLPFASNARRHRQGFVKSTRSSFAYERPCLSSIFIQMADALYLCHPTRYDEICLCSQSTMDLSQSPSCYM